MPTPPAPPSAPGQMCALDVGSGFGNAGAVWATTTTPVWHFQEETRSPRVLSEPGKPGFGQVVLQHVCCKRSGWRGAGAAGTERGVQCLGKEHFWSFPSSCGRTHPHELHSSLLSPSSTPWGSCSLRVSTGFPDAALLASRRAPGAPHAARAGMWQLLLQEAVLAPNPGQGVGRAELLGSTLWLWGCSSETCWVGAPGVPASCLCAFGGSEVSRLPLGSCGPCLFPGAMAPKRGGSL